MDTIQLRPGDPCPSCSGKFRMVPEPTEAQRRAASDRTEPVALPRYVDNATPEQIQRLGNLFVCDRCGYRTRHVLSDDVRAELAASAK